ncbi:MAG: hypothetical protein LUG12_09650 [Erysipelotrichaceae bacterium]|nr:hypothetical protein [Erysipelotrichaceae bacterium]
MLFSTDSFKISSAENDLNDIVEEINEDISNGNFKSARIKVYTLNFDKDLSEEKYEYWEQKKTELLEYIDEIEEATTSYNNTKENLLSLKYLNYI